MKHIMTPTLQSDKTRLRENYDALAPFFDTARSHMVEGVIPFVLSNLPTRKGRALDIGCGAGQLMRRLSPEFEEVWGVDFSPKMLQAARPVTAGCSNVRFEEMDAEALAFADGMFDFVVGIAILHHIDPLKGVREAARVLRPGGRLLFMGPSQGGPVKSSSPTGISDDQGEFEPQARRRWARIKRIARENLRLARALGVRNLLLWKRLWTRQVQAQTPLLTFAQWREVAQVLPGSQAGHYRYYVHVVWDKPGAESAPG